MPSTSSVLLALTLSAAAAFGQLDSNSITVSVARTANLQPDQALFAVYLDTGTNTSLNEVLAILTPAGIAASNFSGVSTLPNYIVNPAGEQPPPTLEWAFGLAVPLGRLKDTVAALTSLQQSIARQKNGTALNFSVQGTQISPQLQQAQVCSTADLLTDARIQAQKLADAAGMTLGPILAISTASSNNAVGGAFVAAARAVVVSGNTGFSPSCSITVKYGASRY